MAALTEKENLLRMFDGEVPEWIPRYTLGPVRGGKKAPAVATVMPGFLSEPRRNGGGKDIWGVEYITSREAAGGLLPKTWDFLLDDVTKWRNVIKAPDLDSIDFEMMSKKDLEWVNVDRSQTALSLNIHAGYFQALMAFMGFTEGLCALFDEPEECKALFEYLGDFYCRVIEKCIDYYKPDIFDLVDDTAAWGNPFISKEMYREYLLPLYDKEVSYARERGIRISYHNCGKCEGFIEDAYKIGVRTWNPAQVCNDLEAIQKKYGRDLILCGCWDAMKVVDPKNTEEDIYEYLRNIAEARAKNGGFCFMATILIPDDDDKRMLWVNDTVNKAIEEISRSFYK